MYSCIPFGLINVGDTFQRTMDRDFVGDQDKSVVVYLDDITIFSNTEGEHIAHLEFTFEKFRRYSLSLNPKKSQFALSEGKLPGHVVS